MLGSPLEYKIDLHFLKLEETLLLFQIIPETLQSFQAAPENIVTVSGYFVF